MVQEDFSLAKWVTLSEDEASLCYKQLKVDFFGFSKIQSRSIFGYLKWLVAFLAMSFAAFFIFHDFPSLWNISLSIICIGIPSTVGCILVLNQDFENDQKVFVLIEEGANLEKAQSVISSNYFRNLKELHKRKNLILARIFSIAMIVIPTIAACGYFTWVASPWITLAFSLIIAWAIFKHSGSLKRKLSK
ncbi:MAG: hypothetical protein K1000chlam3_00456 [Chlamydiae bacterium]|nr:hypothetical protein [Chlamydiota bacterium]